MRDHHTFGQVLLHSGAAFLAVMIAWTAVTAVGTVGVKFLQWL
jgi:hypothetical protein